MGINVAIKTITKDVVTTESLTCDDCGCAIPLVFPEIEGRTWQGKDALLIEFDGGYGMYIDPLNEAAKQAVLCKDCADKLRQQHPWIDKIIRSEDSL